MVAEGRKCPSLFEEIRSYAMTNRIKITTADGHSFSCDIKNATRWIGRNEWVKLYPDEIVLQVANKKQSEDTLAFLWIKALKKTLRWRKQN
jgi:hypothetical protein